MTPAVIERFRERVQGTQRSVRDVLRSTNFPQQRLFVEDDSTFATADCSRRAGKSRGIAAWLLEGPILDPEAPSLYFTISRKEAKRIMWGPMLKLNRDLKLGYEPNASELVLYRNGVPSVYLQGVNTKDEIEKARGTGWGRVAADEAQTLPQYVQDMIDDVLLPSFIDHDGKLRIIGTPSPVPAGFFYDTLNNPEYSHHSWTVWDNPYLKDKAPAMLAKVLRVRGVTVDDPSIRREWFGEWKTDLNSLVFRYDRVKNAAERPSVGTWHYVIGVDLGFDDADAISVLAWTDDSPDIYLVDEWVGTKQSITDLGLRLGTFKAKYDPLDIVADTGGLGKKIADEISQRTGIPISAAEKERKLEHIELLNDALRSGRFYAKPDSRFAQDCMLVEWDRTNPEKPKISDRYHSDICDSVLYAYRRAQHWLYEPRADVPEVGSNEWMNATEREMLQAAEQAVREQKAQRQDLDDQMGWI